MYAELLTTRALVSGRRTYEHAGHWNGDHHDGVPILVLTHDVPAEPPPDGGGDSLDEPRHRSLRAAHRYGCSL